MMLAGQVTQQHQPFLADFSGVSIVFLSRRDGCSCHLEEFVSRRRLPPGGLFFSAEACIRRRATEKRGLLTCTWSGAFIGLPESFTFEASNFAARKSWSKVQAKQPARNLRNWVS